MATQINRTSKARDRQIQRTLDAAERMANRTAGQTGRKGGETSSLSSDPSLARCPECGAAGEKNCCWYSRSNPLPSDTQNTDNREAAE